MSKTTKKHRQIQQIPFRLHTNDHRALKSKTAIEGLKIQTLVEACVLAYLEGDEHIKKLAHEHKNLNTINKKKASWSNREQNSLLDEIESVVDTGDNDA